jgi:acyl dehydratase
VNAMEHRLRAVNEPGSLNLVHDDEFARRLGFKAGLVPGVTVYGYMAVLPARHWGERWMESGGMSARFLKPVYDGDEVTAAASPTESGLELELRDSAGEVCASGHAEASAEEPPPRLERYPSLALPVPAGPPAFAEGQALGSLATSVRLIDHAWPARLANEVLVANVQLPPWIHVESRTRHLGPVRDGEPVEVRALVAGLWERRGHRFVDLDVVVLGEHSKPVAQLRHVAIYELAQLRADGPDADSPATTG